MICELTCCAKLYWRIGYPHIGNGNGIAGGGGGGGGGGNRSGGSSGGDGGGRQGGNRSGGSNGGGDKQPPHGLRLDDEHGDCNGLIYTGVGGGN